MAMNRKPIAEFIARAARSAAPLAAVATSFAAPLAQAASGDLDPSFADHGRLDPIAGATGTAWSIDALDDGSFFVGGGDVGYNWQCWYDWDCNVSASSFAARVGADGIGDPDFVSESADHVQAFGIARQADGKIVAAGRYVDRMVHHRLLSGLAVFRLDSDGSLDAGFGADGLFQLPGDASGSYGEARAVRVDADGRIVIAGFRMGAAGSPELIVLRLTTDGQPDSTFGADGIYAGPVLAQGAGIGLAQAAAGGYRIAATTADGCAVVGLTGSGATDLAFGSAGIASVESAPGTTVTCAALEQQPDGSLLVAGSAGDRGFVARLLAGGARDASFAADDAVAGNVHAVNSVAADSGGGVLVAGSGLKGATVMRLQATGALDAEFGDAGRAWIDLDTEYAGSTSIVEIAARSDGGVLAVGNDGGSGQPFAVRLQGAHGGSSAGVVGFAEGYAEAAESDGQAVIHLRRSGGSTGAVHVDWRTVADSDATEGVDYASATGRIHWADGESGEREITVPIAEDAGAPEGYEGIHLALGDPAGGAGAGARNATIYIRPDGAPAGQISVNWYTDFTEEGSVAQIYLTRDYYSEGEVSVTVTFDGISAEAGDDFPSDAVTVTWAADDADGKLVELNLLDDASQEDAERFSFELSNPTGGAILGNSTSGTISIAASDAPVRVPPPHRTGGGGASGFLALLLLGFLQLFRGSRRRT